MIYIADDHADTAEFLVRMLKKGGFEVASFSRCDALLEAMRMQRPALVVLDYMFPEMDGLVLLGMIRADASLATVPVIMYTADSSEETAQRARKAGANHVVLKGGLNWPEFKEMIVKLTATPTRNRPPFNTVPTPTPTRE